MSSAMSQVPLPLAIPAIAAAAAYLNARAAIFYDVHLLQSILRTLSRVFWNQYVGRLNIYYIFESLATSKSSANRLFLRFQDKTWTYAEAYELVLRHAQWLTVRHGVKKGETVALDFQNTESFVFFVLAVWSTGATPALINYNLAGRPLVHCIKRAGSRLVLIDPAVVGNASEDVRAELSGVQFVAFTPEAEADVHSMEAVRLPDEPRADAQIDSTSALIFTSGTTGLPKAAIISWGKMLIVGHFTARWIGTRSTDVFYSAMPLYHGTAMIMGFSHLLSVGATFALGHKFSTSHFWDDVRKHDATIIQYVGEACRYLLAAPPRIDPATGENLDRKHRVRIAYGNGLRPDIWNRFKERFGIDTVAEFYAATEGSFGTWNLSRNEFTAGSIGRGGWFHELAMGANVAVVELDYENDVPLRDPKTGFCHRVRPGEPGELMFKLPANNIKSRFQGYYGDKEATDKKIMRSVFAKGDAWFRTGDVIRKDTDRRMYFTDRIGDTFRWKSENVSTEEVAEVMGLHPAIRETNVYGVRVPHHEGRAGCAAITLKEGALGPDGLPKPDELASLAAHVRRGLPKYALPLFLRFVRNNAMESTGTHKFPKNVLRDQGVEPGKTAPDEIYWLRGDAYVKFEPKDWDELDAGRVSL